MFVFICTIARLDTPESNASSFSLKIYRLKKIIVPNIWPSWAEFLKRKNVQDPDFIIKKCPIVKILFILQRKHNVTLCYLGQQVLKYEHTIVKDVKSMHKNQ